MSKLESFSPSVGHAPDASDAFRKDLMSSAKPGAIASRAVPTDGAAVSPGAKATTVPFELAEATPNPIATPTSEVRASVPSDLAPVPEAAVNPGSPAAAVAPSDGTMSIPAPIQSAIDAGQPVRFSSAGENQAANRQPDYFLNTNGQLVKNDQATPSADGSINIQIQPQGDNPANNKSLRDAIIHESDMQRQAAQEMIRLYQKNHPGQPVPSWMTDLASAKPNVPDFTPFNANPNQPASAAPENGFVNRGTHGSAGFAGNGGFDGQGNFRGNGSAGDGTLNTGAYDGKGQPIGPGETVQAKQIYDYMTEKYGLSPAVASGILGNMMTESSFKTNAHNAAEGAIGLCQWEGGRRTELEHFAAAQGKPVTDWHTQVDFMMHELKGSESGAFAKLQHAQTPQQAAAIFDQYFERSSGEARGQRMANAENLYHKVSTPNPHTPAPAVS